MRQRGPGDTLAQALARSWRDDKPDEPPDVDEHCANLVARGYSPGLASQLAQRLGDTMAELQGEREKIEKAELRAGHVRRMHETGQIGAWEIQQRLGDEGDAHRCEQLERRAESLRRQLGEAQAMIAPAAGREPDPLEAASRRAHETFVSVTRAKMAEAQEVTSRESVTRARRPFAGAAAAGEVTRSRNPALPVRGRDCCWYGDGHAASSCRPWCRNPGCDNYDNHPGPCPYHERASA
jgi:hypothetical protein